MANKTASFTMPGVMPPYGADMAASQMEQQQLAEALAQVRGQGPTQPINAGRFSALNFEGVGNTIREAMLQKRQDVARKKAADLQGSYQKDLLRDLTAYTANRDGGEVPVAGPPEAGAAPPTRSMPSNPLAFKSGQLSQFPEIRAAAGEDRKSHEALYGKLLEKASPTSALAAGGDDRLLRPKSDQKVVNHSVMEMGGEVGQAPTILPGMGVTQKTLPTGTVVNVQPGGAVDAVEKAPRINNTIVNKLGDNPMKAAMDLLPDDLKNAQGANSILRSTETILSAFKDGAKSGSLEPVMQKVRTAITSITGVPFEAAPPTGVVLAELAKIVLAESGGKLGGGFSDGDRNFMNDTVGGITSDPKALERILSIRAAVAHNKLRAHNANVIDLTSQPGVTNPDYLRRRFTVEHANVKLNFTTPESRASYLAGKDNIPYEDALRASQDEVAKPGRYSPADLELFRKHGYTPKGN